MNVAEAISFKVVVVGPFGAGKTTLISAISEIPVVSTDVAASSADESARKAETTVSMDFGVRTVEDDDLVVKLFVYGTPGQERFSFMWDVLARGMDGYVVLVDSTDPVSWQTARRRLEYFRGIGEVPHLVAANRAAPGSAVLTAIAAELGSGGVPVVACNVAELESAKSVLIDLLFLILEDLVGGGGEGDGATDEEIGVEAALAPLPVQEHVHE